MAVVVVGRVVRRRLLHTGVGSLMAREVTLLLQPSTRRLNKRRLPESAREPGGPRCGDNPSCSRYKTETQTKH